VSRPPLAQVTESYPSGHWRVYARPYGEAKVDITFVRGVKTKVTSLTTTDPFGPAAGSLTFPAISYLDAVGSGDLAWCVPNVDIDVVWTSPEYTDVDDDGEEYTVGSYDAYTWEGYAAEWDFGDADAAGGLTIPLVGALHQADNYLAKPEYPYQPLPYEYAIITALDDCGDRRWAETRGKTKGKWLSIIGWAKGPVTGQVSVHVTNHGFDARDRVAVLNVASAKGTVNNGIYTIVSVPDVNHFVVKAPRAAVGKSVSKQGNVFVEVATIFPDWWTTVFNRYDTVAYPADKTFLLPTGVSHGQKWSGMLTRDTGKFDQLLSAYIQGLLSNMHTLRGQFTLLLDKGRVPYLTHREHLHAPNAATLVVDALWPGVKVNPRIDHTQQIGVVYAQGKATNGDTYTGMQVTADGSRTWYDPAASRRQVHPQAQNPWLDRRVMRKEVMVNYSDGLDEQEAKKASADHLQRFADPGVTATITLSVDPVLNLVVDADGNVTGGQPVPRQMIQAGQSIQVKGLFGKEAGVLFHITEANLSEDSTMSLTVDSLYRDHLTVDQVRKRGHDSLVPYRVLSTSGQYDPRIPDLLYPWSYAKGSGVIPYGGAPLFTKFGPAKVAKGTVADPYAVPFPWTPYTTAYPPKSNPSMYIRVPPSDHQNASNNWANAYNRLNTSGRFTPYYTVLAAAGEIKLFQIAAYDKDGNVKAVPFHVSLWYLPVSYLSMPRIPSAGWVVKTKNATASVSSSSHTITVTGLPKGHGFSIGDSVALYTTKKVAAINGTWSVATVSSTGMTIDRGSNAGVTTSSKCQVSAQKLLDTLEFSYDAGQNYPFFPQAWEKILPNGQTPTYLSLTQAASGNPVIYGAGTGYEKCGYWPGSGSDHDLVTGMFSDESGFSFDFRGQSQGIDALKTPAQNQSGKTPFTHVRAFVMIYCDEDTAASTYFLGRAFRKEYQG